MGDGVLTPPGVAKLFQKYARRGVATNTLPVPIFVSLVAVTVVDPGATAVTRPVPDTVAVALTADSQATTRPGRSVLSAARVMAASWNVLPGPTTIESGATATAATGTAATETCAVPVCPPALAVMVTGPPTATPVIVPVGPTVRTAGLFEVQVTDTVVQYSWVTLAMSVAVLATFKVAGAPLILMALTVQVGVVLLLLLQAANITPTAKVARENRIEAPSRG